MAITPIDQVPPDAWTAIFTGLLAVVAVAAAIIAWFARADSRSSAESAERSAEASEQSAESARGLLDVERERLDIELQPQFQLACRVNTIRVYNEGPIDYDSVTLRLLETDGGQAYVGIGDDQAQETTFGPVPVDAGYDVRVTRAETTQDRVRVELLCRRGNTERSRVFECRAHRSARSRRPRGSI